MNRLRTTAMVMGWVFATLFLSAFDINDTLSSAGERTYMQMLREIKSAPPSDERALQVTLLNKLILLDQNRTGHSVALPAVSGESGSLRSLVHTLIRLTQEYGQTASNLEDLQRKIRQIRQQAALEESNVSDALTLQLQHAFYRKLHSLYLHRRDRIQKDKKHLFELIETGVKTLRIDPESIQKNSEDLRRKIKDIDRSLRQVRIEKERLQLLGKSDGLQKLRQAETILFESRKKLIEELVSNRFLLYGDALKRHDAKRAFALQNEITGLLDRNENSQVVEAFKSLMRRLDNRILGRAETLKGATLQEVQSAGQLFWRKLNAPIFHINQTAISTVKLLLALVIFVLGFFFGGLYKRSIRNLGMSSETITQSTQTLLANLGYYLIVIIAFFASLNALGINLSSIALVAGALSVGIGFGLQNIVSNFVSGLILMFERSIKIGDYVEFDTELRGRVSDIRMRSTTITTNDNIDVIVPNQELIQNRVINWTMNDRIRRFRIPFGVAYGTDPKRVVETVLSAVAKSGFRDLYTSRERITRVIMTGMGDSSVDFELFVWIKGKEILYPKRTQSRFLTLIYTALGEAGIEIPYPQRDLHIRSVDLPIPVSIADSDGTEQTNRKGNR